MTNWSFEKIKEKLFKMYASDENYPGREMLIYKCGSDYGATGVVLFSLVGSPPKGTALYSPEYMKLLFIDSWFKTKVTLAEIIIPELDSIPQGVEVSF